MRFLVVWKLPTTYSRWRYNIARFVLRLQFSSLARVTFDVSSVQRRGAAPPYRSPNMRKEFEISIKNTVFSIEILVLMPLCNRKNLVGTEILILGYYSLIEYKTFWKFLQSLTWNKLIVTTKSWYYQLLLSFKINILRQKKSTKQFSYCYSNIYMTISTPPPYNQRTYNTN